MKKWMLGLVVVLAFVLRFYNLGSLPSGFTPDEASFGYDAYSILKTGRDQWGRSFPLVLESFGDFKSPLYAYLTVPSVLIFGLNEFAVRLPNALLGTLSVYVIYLLVSELTLNKRIGLIAASLLAINSWHIMLSRGAFEANLITFFLPLGVYLFLKQKYNLSSLVLGISLFSYHSSKLIVPVVFVVLMVLFKVKKITSVLIFSVFFLLMLYGQSLGGSARIKERSITAGALEAGAKVKIELIQNGANPILAKLAHNKYQVVISRFLNNYKQYFSPQFMFTQGPVETTYGMIPGIGVIYLFEGIFLLGLIHSYNKYKNQGHSNQRHKNLILITFGFLLLSPIPAALATGVGYSANRASGMIIPLIVLEAIGAYEIFERYKDSKKYLTLTLGFIIAFGFLRFINAYYIKSYYTASPGMLYGNMEIARWLNENNKANKTVLVDKSLSEPHIYFAFAGKINPEIFQKDSKAWKYTTWVDQMDEYVLDGIVYKDIKKTDFNSDTILIGRPDDFKSDFIPDKVISYPDGKPAIYVKNN